jgi:CheY-specific phosphatase CheX
MSNDTTMLDLMQKVAEELFATYGLTATPITPRSDHESLNVKMASIIGFTGQKLRGTMMLAISAVPLARSKASDVADRDWLAELGNQLLGRLKNRLARYDVDITMSTPLVIHGERLSPTMHGDHAPYRWLLPDGEANVWFDVEFSPDFELRESSTATEVVAEGESMLF